MRTACRIQRMGKGREQEETRVTDLRNGGSGGWGKREGFSAAVQDRGERQSGFPTAQLTCSRPKNNEEWRGRKKSERSTDKVKKDATTIRIA